MADSKNSISSFVYNIQEQLSNLQKEWPALKKQEASDNASTTGTFDLHAYGPVNLDKARQEFRQQIDAIRSVCLQFENEVLGDVMKMGAGADPAFRKHFTHLKEQAALESTVRKVKDALKQTKDHLEQCVTEREESRLKKSIKSLERIAQGMGLVTFVDSSQTSESGVPLTTLTLGGTVIVVDIDMDDTGHVLKTKVTYVSEILQNDHDDRLDRMLAEILRTEDYDLFRRNLGTLALLDRLNVKYTPTNFFLLTRGLVADMRSICSQEALLVSGDMGTILMEGHGVPSLYLDYPGLSIAYWIDKKSMLDTDWESVRKSVENGDKHTALRPAAKLNISFEASEQSHYFLPPSRTRYLLSLEETEDYILEGENGKHMKILRETACPKFMQPMRFIKVLSTHPEAAAIPVRMVATLDPPLPASDTIIQSLMRITGYKKQEELAEFNMDATGSLSNTTPSLEQLLLSQAIVSQSQQQSATAHQKVSWIAQYDDMQDQIYQWVNKTSTSGKMLSRIPFTHLAQLYPMMQVLRQQQMFNTLVQSIFNPSTYRLHETSTERVNDLSLDSILKESETDDKLRFDVATAGAPHSIHITFSPPPTADHPLLLIPLSITIPTDNPTRPTVSVHRSSSKEMDTLEWKCDPKIFDEEKMTRVLQAGHHIPLLMRWLWKRIERYEGNYMFKTMKRARGDDASEVDNKHMKSEMSIE